MMLTASRGLSILVDLIPQLIICYRSQRLTILRQSAAHDVLRTLELIALLNDRPKVGKAKHHNECDQQPDCAEPLQTNPGR
jgi:hypothetical protein